MEKTLPAYCQELVARVEKDTSHPLQVVEKHLLEFDSEVKLARPGQGFHTLLYRSEYREFREHFIVNAAFKILRAWEQPEKERYVPASNVGRLLPEGDHQELVRKLPRAMGEDEGNMMSRFLYGAIGRQLTSFPVDLRVEQEIAASVPEHHEEQVAYLERQVQDFMPTLDESMLEMLPEHIYQASTAMNIAFAKTAAELAQVVPDPALRIHSSRRVAELLLEDLNQIKVHGCPGDRLLTDAWAKELGLEGFYKWIRMEELRE